ncbi:MAG: PIG-L family deacetylase [Actinomycetota bacterium]|nr:PIG-L family deacetylase [Actinomycetota bacterium]
MAANDSGRPPLTSTAAWTSALPTPDVVLAVGAHPDDVEFGCGGTLAKWAGAGCTVHHLICTDGSKGTWDVDADTAALVRIRQDEQRQAARLLAGDRVGEASFLGEVDGELSSGLGLREQVVRVVRRLRPDVVLGHDPWKRYRIHPDHRHAGFLTVDAIASARDPHAFREQGLAAHRPLALLLFEADDPDHVEDVTRTVAAKLAALEAHRSQFESTMYAADEDELQAFRNRIRSQLEELGAPHGFGAAEVFKRIDDL